MSWTEENGVDREKMTAYKFTTDVNPDTELLGEMLRDEFRNVMNCNLTAMLDRESLETLAWYRVAARAKELRA